MGCTDLPPYLVKLLPVAVLPKAFDATSIIYFLDTLYAGLFRNNRLAIRASSTGTPKSIVPGFLVGSTVACIFSVSAEEASEPAAQLASNTRKRKLLAIMPHFNKFSSWLLQIISSDFCWGHIASSTSARRLRSPGLTLQLPG